MKRWLLQPDMRIPCPLFLQLLALQVPLFGKIEEEWVGPINRPLISDLVFDLQGIDSPHHRRQRVRILRPNAKGILHPSILQGRTQALGQLGERLMRSAQKNLSFPELGKYALETSLALADVFVKFVYKDVVTGHNGPNRQASAGHGRLFHQHGPEAAKESPCLVVFNCQVHQH